MEEHVLKRWKGKRTCSNIINGRAQLITNQKKHTHNKNGRTHVQALKNGRTRAQTLKTRIPRDETLKIKSKIAQILKIEEHVLKY